MMILANAIQMLVLLGASKNDNEMLGTTVVADDGGEKWCEQAAKPLNSPKS